MAEDPNPPGDVPPASGTSAGEGPGNESTPPAAVSLEDINKLSGRNYATLEEAQKGLQETYKFVGQKPKIIVQEKIVEKIPDGMVPRSEYEAANFFRDNAEANKHQALVSQIAKANGITVQEAFKSEFIQTTIKQLNVAEETANTRSALTSNPRLGVVSDASTKAQEAFETSQKARAGGDMLTADRLQKQAESAALDAVVKHYGMGGQTIVD